MAHTTEEKKKLLTRVNRLQGQLEGIRVAIEEEQECASVLQQIAACRGAINSLLVEIIDGESPWEVGGQLGLEPGIPTVSETVAGTKRPRFALPTKKSNRRRTVCHQSALLGLHNCA